MTATVSIQSTSSTTASSIAESEELRHYPWYRSIDRKQAEELLKQRNIPIFLKFLSSTFSLSLSVNSNGGFLVRESKHGGANSPFTLTVFNQGTVFNINIRLRPDGFFALGKEKTEENVSLRLVFVFTL